jgi:hypothetical protein
MHHVRTLEPLGLGEAAADVDGDDQPEERDQVDESPAAVAEVGERERHHGDPATEPAAIASTLTA